jgi:hypothetical protein
MLTAKRNCDGHPALCAVILFGIGLVIMGFAGHLTISSKGYLHRTPAQSSKATIAKCRGVSLVQPATERSSEYLLDSRLGHADLNLTESVYGNRMAENKKDGATHKKQDECGNYEGSSFHAAWLDAEQYLLGQSH